MSPPKRPIEPLPPGNNIKHKKTMKTALEIPDFAITQVPNIDPGDADVNTQKGRNTIVTVRSEGLTLTPDAKALQFMLIYSIQEGSPDHTHLEYRGKIVLPAPDGWKITEYGPGVIDVAYANVFVGKDHDWHDDSDQAQGSYLTNLSLKFDGPGDDDQGNAQLKASILIPVTLESLSQ